jgi:hypothetical protein
MLNLLGQVGHSLLNLSTKLVKHGKEWVGLVIIAIGLHGTGDNAIPSMNDIETSLDILKGNGGCGRSQHMIKCGFVSRGLLKNSDNPSKHFILTNHILYSGKAIHHHLHTVNDGPHILVGFDGYLI